MQVGTKPEDLGHRKGKITKYIPKYTDNKMIM